MILYVQGWKEGNLPEPHDNERLDTERNEPDEPEQSARPHDHAPGRGPYVLGTPRGHTNPRVASLEANLLSDGLEEVEDLADIALFGLEEAGQPPALVAEAHVEHGLQRHTDPWVGVLGLRGRGSNSLNHRGRRFLGGQGRALAGTPSLVVECDA